MFQKGQTNLYLDQQHMSVYLVMPSPTLKIKFSSLDLSICLVRNLNDLVSICFIDSGGEYFILAFEFARDFY